MPCAPSQGARIYYEETGKLVEDLFDVVPGGVNGVLIFMMVLIFVLKRGRGQHAVRASAHLWAADAGVGDLPEAK